MIKKTINIFSASVLHPMCQASSWVILPPVYSSSHTARKTRPKVRNRHVQSTQRRALFGTDRPISSTSPQMLLRNWSLCCRRIMFPHRSPSPDWFRPWLGKVTWQASVKCSRWWRVSARPSTCPACCLSTTRPWHTSESKTILPVVSPYKLKTSVIMKNTKMRKLSILFFCESHLVWRFEKVITSSVTWIFTEQYQPCIVQKHRLTYS